MGYRLFLTLLSVALSLVAIGQQPGNPSSGNSQIPAASTLVDATKKDKSVWLELEFSLEGGFYNETIQVELFSPGAKIFFTTDGSTPSNPDRMFILSQLIFQKQLS